jgi:hypothetical protein
VVCEISELHTASSHGQRAVGEFLGYFEVPNGFNRDFLQVETITRQENVRFNGPISLGTGNNISKGEASAADIYDLPQFGKFRPNNSKCALMRQESLVFSSLSELFLVHLINFLQTIWEIDMHHCRFKNRNILSPEKLRYADLLSPQKIAEPLISCFR